MEQHKPKIELLAPAGNMQKLKTAFRFGADAVYIAGKKFGLRACADNFSGEELESAVAYAHALNKKLYVTVNIYPDSNELDEIADYGKFLADIGADGAIISDLGVFSRIRASAPKLELHVSTQANVTNSAAALAWAVMGAKRIVLARELSLSQISEIRKALPKEVELEAFVHGAMCIAYSGRCLLSAYFTGRGGNKGECVQCCRWEYGLTEKSRGETLEITEDERGTYILSSRDLCMIEHLGGLIDAGVVSFKIEGRVKSEYYVAGVVNAYRRALDDRLAGKPFDRRLLDEMKKISHRGYTTGFYMGDAGGGTGEGKPTATYNFTAVVHHSGEGFAEIEMRNRFETGDVLEVLSPSDAFNREIEIKEIKTPEGECISVADKVQQHLIISTGGIKLMPLDILRKKI